MKEDIIKGEIQPDEKLPSKRAFARNHGVSIITVEAAYGQLMAEGYIYSKPKSGFYVSEIPVKPQEINSKLYEHRDGDERKKETGKNTLPLSLTSNHISALNFPFSVWAKINRQVLSEQDAKLLTAPPVGGVVELREAIARHLRDFRGIDVSYEQIIVGAGTEYLYNLIVQLLGREKSYGLENPGSRKIRNIYQALGVKLVSLSMDEEGVSLEQQELEETDIIQISPSHHFPTGIVTSASRRYGLLQWANERNHRYIIEDDYDSEFRLQGRPIPSLFSMDTTDKVIYLNTFTKSIAPTIRISYMVLPKSLLKEYQEKLGFYSCTVSNFEQSILARFIKERHFERHINRTRNYYRTLRDDLISRIKCSALGEKVQIREEHAGLHFLLFLDTEKKDDELKKLAAMQGISVDFLSEYVVVDNERPHQYEHLAIINYSGCDEISISEIVKGLEKAWI